MKHAVRAEWIDAWADKAAGFCLCELREFPNGSTHVHRGEPVHLADCSADVAALFSIYITAEQRLKKAAQKGEA
jgi:hypothetical protein